VSAPSRLAAALDGRYRIERELGQGGISAPLWVFDRLKLVRGMRTGQR
jgi:hypothetical protein